MSEAKLQRAKFISAQLEKVNLSDARLQKADLWQAHLQEATLRWAQLHKAVLSGAQLQMANLAGAELCKADLWQARLEKANLLAAQLQSANLQQAKLQDANLQEAQLQKANLIGARLQNATLKGANLKGANFSGTILLNTIFSGVRDIDTRTDFSEANLSEAILSPELEVQLEYNIRRKYWSQWCRESRWVYSWLVRLFWWSSDYGTSSKRLIKVFAGLTVLFAAFYFPFPNCLVGLKYFEVPQVGAPSSRAIIEVHGWMLMIRSIYFSIITMTTLGFGDVHAYPNSFWGHIVLSAQVLVGYFLLGALITRFGIMFTSKAPCPTVPRAKQDQWLWFNRIKRKVRFRFIRR